jgi:hypothetical protein
MSLWLPEEVDLLLLQADIPPAIRAKELAINIGFTRVVSFILLALSEKLANIITSTRYFTLLRCT